MNNLIKSLITLFILTITLSTFPAKAKSSSGEDRCKIKGCLCEVALSPAKGRYSVQKRSISIYFEENSSTISLQQQSSTSVFLKQIRDYGHSVSIIGYTDGCGSTQHNISLAKKRADEVYAHILKEIRPIRVERIIGGERSLGHRAEARRVDVVFHTKNKLTTLIEKMPSDFYLIDASGSMQGQVKTWNDIISASKKPGSRVFLSITGGCRDFQKISQVTPHGGTEIWWSYWTIIDKMEPGQTLLIISDFESRVPLSSRESRLFKDKVRESKIIVRSIRL